MTVNGIFDGKTVNYTEVLSESDEGSVLAKGADDQDPTGKDSSVSGDPREKPVASDSTERSPSSSTDVRNIQGDVFVIQK